MIAGRDGSYRHAYFLQKIPWKKQISAQLADAVLMPKINAKDVNARKTVARTLIVQVDQTLERRCKINQNPPPLTGVFDLQNSINSLPYRHMKTFISIVIVVVLLVGIFIALDQIRVPEPKSTATPSQAVETPTPEVGGEIHVFSPEPNSEIGLPVTIKGEARTFEATFLYRIKNSDGQILIEGHSMTTGTEDYPAFRPFEVVVNYPDPKTASGSIEVFGSSTKDGSEVNKVVVPVVFKKVDGATSVKLYFDLLTPTNTRIPKTDTPIRATLDELFKGLGSETKIEGVSIASGVLTVDLSGTVTAVDEAKITKTAMQFASVKSVVIK